MKAISLKLKDEIFEEVEKMVKEIHVSRNAYINNALELYNKLHRKRKIRKLLKEASLNVGKQSMDILHEMEDLDPHLIQ